MPPVLYVVATPLGNLEDVSLRALRVLKEADLIFAEDTRKTRKLLAANGIMKKNVKSCHAANEGFRLVEACRLLDEGKVLALVTDAGTPGVSDPGALLVSAARDAGHSVVPIPGPSAVTAALSASGFSGKGFHFLGFPPRKNGPRRRYFEEYSEAAEPLVFFESPHRIKKTLAVLAEVLETRTIVLFREMTKIYEESLRGNASDVLLALGDPVRGEVVVVLEGAAKTKNKVSKPRLRDTSLEAVAEPMGEEVPDEGSRD